MSDTMERNKATAQKLYDQVINQENRSVLEEIYASGVIIHDPFLGTAIGISALHQLLDAFDIGFPHHRASIDGLIAEGEYVVALHTHSGVHQGEFMGVAPTGKQIVISGVEVMRLQAGKIIEFWRKDDDISLFMQLGILSTPKPT